MVNLERLFELTKRCAQNDARLVAVSKTKPASDILEAYGGGQRIFGENRAAELAEKHDALPKDIEWHMIGHLQRNKVKDIAPFVHMIHSVDSLRLAREIDKQAARSGRTIPVLLQVHIALESSKYGFSAEELHEVLADQALQDLRNIRICGVMGMATFTDDRERIRKEFRYLHDTFDSIRAAHFKDNHDFREISMGMTGDFDIALEEGSTLVRIGSAIFGER